MRFFKKKVTKHVKRGNNLLTYLVTYFYISLSCALAYGA